MLVEWQICSWSNGKRNVEGVSSDPFVRPTLIVTISQSCQLSCYSDLLRTNQASIHCFASCHDWPIAFAAY